jgi:hypothetical protein
MPRTTPSFTQVYSPYQWEPEPSPQYYTVSTSSTTIDWEEVNSAVLNVWWDAETEYKAEDGSILPKVPQTNHDYIRYMQAGVPIPYPDVEEICAERRQKEFEKQQAWLQWLSQAEQTGTISSPAPARYTVE